MTYTGVEVVHVPRETIDILYKFKFIDSEDQAYPNKFVVLKSEDGSGSALARVAGSGFRMNLIRDNLSASTIKPRNKEQAMAFDMLLDDSVTVCVLTGKAGSGKTILALAAALEKLEDGKYKRIILTRPMSQVGEFNLGILPGNVDEKFIPYLGNFQGNLQQLGKDIKILMERYDVECIPLQLIRGCSFIDTYIICDEAQVMNEKDMLTLGTRVGDNSKLIIMGDLDQIDGKIKKEETGLYKLMNSETSKESPLVAAIELLKIERSATAKLFTEIFNK